jgi:hypothetical protein
LKKVRAASESDPGLTSLQSNVGFGREFEYEEEREGWRFCALTDREAQQRNKQKQKAQARLAVKTQQNPKRKTRPRDAF